MKPTSRSQAGRFPRIDCFFQSGADRGHGYWSNDDGDFRPCHLGREYLIEAARERAKERAVFAVILAAAAWPVIYMIFTIVQVFHHAAH